jgi:hypothetical protein
MASPISVTKNSYAGLLGDAISDNLKGVFLTFKPRQFGVNSLHEAMEMHTVLAAQRQAVVKGINQIGFPPPYATPKIQADLGFNFYPTNFAHPGQQSFLVAIRIGRYQSLIEVLQQQHSLFLRGIVGKIRALQVRLIALPGCCHIWSGRVLLFSQAAHFSDSLRPWQRRRQQQLHATAAG